jgi:cysteine-rich repeat protein
MMGRLRLAVVCVLALCACKVPNASRTQSSTGPVCGNGIVEPGEVCDDGNTVSGDGCSADCTSDESCGNGIVDTDVGEQCDDGNNVSCDGCSADCKSDETCGNGIIDKCKGETCDDGNRVGGDGCSANCQSNEKCGNGFVDTSLGEQCDPGGNVQTAMCEADCKLHKCGDGILNKLAGEECDDGNNVSGDGCDDKCRIEKCGNKRVEDDEQCDDGVNALNGPCPACRLAVCGDFHTWTTPAPPKEECDEGPMPSPHGACPALCKDARCGDGYLWNLEGGTEQCDTSGVDSAQCNGGTCLFSMCGDGYTNRVAGEQCDSSGVDSPTCVGATCMTSICGDMYTNAAAGEQCDLGMANSDTGACTSTCQNPRCGDGYVEAGVEQCDSGGVDTSTCNAGTCTFSMCGDLYTNMAAGEQCDLGVNNSDTGACTSRCQNATCGDGLVYAGVESCDTGGTDTVECNGGNCTFSMCGDGYVNMAAGEQCDHMMNNGADGVCDATCQCVVAFPCQ